MEQKIKVVHLLHTMDYGGIETIIINWLRIINTQYFDISIVCFANPGNTEKKFVVAAQDAGFTVQTIPWNRKKPILRSSAELKKILIEKQADILHTHNTYADIVGIATKARINIKLISSVYVWANFGWKRNVLQWINQKVLCYFDIVTVQCEATLEESVKRGINKNILRVLHSGFKLNTVELSVEEKNNLRKKYNFTQNNIVLVNIARLYPEKAHKNLLLLFKKINIEFPDTRLLILGTGPLENELYALTEELNISHIVTFAGFITNIDSILKTVDIQVHPSYAEGIPMAILSGMSAGLPIVASAVGGIKEVIIDNKTGLLAPSACEVDFEHSFITQLKVLLSDSNEMIRLRNNARSFIKHEYSLEIAANSLESIYREVI